MVPVQSLLTGALAEVLRKAPLTREKVALAWRAAVGPAVDRATVIELHGDLLRVTARTQVWGREIERSAETIGARLDALLGPGIVREIAVTVAAPPASPQPRQSGDESGSGSPTR